MSKEDWFRAYERNLNNGMSEGNAIKHADEGAAHIQALRLDNMTQKCPDCGRRLNGSPSVGCETCDPGFFDPL